MLKPAAVLCFQVPQRTTSISPALVRKNSPGNGPGLGPRAGAHLIRARYAQSTGGNVGVDICSQSCLRQRCVCVTVATLTCGGPTCTWTLPWREQAAAAPPAPAPPALREAPTSEVSPHSLSVNSQKPDLNPRNPVWALKQAFEGLSV